MGGSPSRRRTTLITNPGSWSSLAYIGSPTKRRPTPINLRCLAGYLLMGKASGVNPEDKSGVGAPKAVRCRFQLVLAAPATALTPCVLALAFPLDHFSDVERGDLLHG